MLNEKELVILAHNIRSVHNVGAIFRTAEGFGVNKIYCSGWTPSPQNGLPHVREKITDQLHKTALGAERIVPNEYIENLPELISELKAAGFIIVGLEQDKKSMMLPNYVAPQKIALLLGEEVHGIEQEFRELCDDLIEIPMNGQKESFNVSVATGIAIYAIKTS